ncbi:MAG: thioredoxin [Acidobacteriota bacterium]|nr:thioredoxin [Acidobacteriota bacterium]
MTLETTIFEVTDTSFNDVLQADRPVLVDFQAPWCGPCRQMSPLLENMAERRDDIMVASVDVDQNQDLAVKYQITSIPTLMMFKNGSVVERLSGAMPVTALNALVERNL